MDNIFCIECGFELPSTAKFCKKCGVQIEASESPSESKPNETILDTPTLQDFTSVKSYKENQNEKGRDERKPLDDSKPKEYNWINWDDDKEYT
jgi:hypothetical protein